MSEALGDVTLSSLRFDGFHVTVDVLNAIREASIARPIDAAPTLTLTLEDPNKTILQSGVFDGLITCQLDIFSFQIVQVKKASRQLTVEFERLEIARLRAHTEPRKVAAGSMTRVDFVRSLIAEEPWLTVVVAPAPIAPIREEIARGNPDKPADATVKRVASTGLPQAPEDTWTAGNRILNEIGWRMFVRGPGEIMLAPDEWIITNDPEATIAEFTGGVDTIDFDFDTGKPIASIKVACRATRWDHAPGAVIAVGGMGPANGKYIVSNVERASLFKSMSTITLIVPEPTFPEPDNSAANTQVDLTQVDLGTDEGQFAPSDTPSADDSGRQVNTGAVSGSGFAWPVRGTITAGFGERRPGHLHEGIDIAVPVGTHVGASKDGTVTFAGELPGYGWVVFIEHQEVDKRPDAPRPGQSVETRYAHLSAFRCTVGQQVLLGDLIGLSGGQPGQPGSGDATGPHVHFEIRIGGTARDPMDFLQGTAVTKPTPKGHFA